MRMEKRQPRVYLCFLEAICSAGSYVGMEELLLAGNPSLYKFSYEVLKKITSIGERCKSHRVLNSVIKKEKELSCQEHDAIRLMLQRRPTMGVSGLGRKEELNSFPKGK